MSQVDILHAHKLTDNYIAQRMVATNEYIYLKKHFHCNKDRGGGHENAGVFTDMPVKGMNMQTAGKPKIRNDEKSGPARLAGHDPYRISFIDLQAGSLLRQQQKLSGVR